MPITGRANLLVGVSALPFLALAGLCAGVLSRLVALFIVRAHLTRREVDR
jgi:hypothetical protein